MKQTRWSGLWATLVMAGGVPGCADEAQPEDIVTITRHDLEGIDAEFLLVLDARFDRFQIDQSSGNIDFSRIELICPNGEAMPMNGWLETQSLDVEADLAALDRFFIGRTTPPQDPPECADGSCECVECHLCPDGMWMCYNTCDEVWDEAQQGWREDHPLDPRLINPDPPPPEDPNDPGDPAPDDETGGDSGGDDGSGGSGGDDGSGGSGGSGGSDGSGSSGGSSGGGSPGGGSGGYTNPGF
jgi:hypothetical protein